MSEESKEYINPYPEYENLTHEELGREMEAVRAELDAAKDKKTQLQKQYDYIVKNVMPRKMEEAGVSSFKLVSGKGIRINDDMYVSSRKDQQPDLFQWLNDNGSGDMIIETVNASSLKAFVKTCIKEGREYPSDLINVKPVQEARFY